MDERGGQGHRAGTGRQGAPLSTLVLTTVGSTGDVVPYLALAQAARARGHRVRVCSHAFHRAYFERHGVEFVPVGAPFEVADFNRIVDEAARQSAPIKQFDVLVQRLFLHEPARQLRDLEVALADADAVVCQRFDYLGQAAAVRRGRPWASVTLAPQLIRTAEAPVYPTPDLGRMWNQFTWLTLEAMSKPTHEHVTRVLRGVGAPVPPLDVAGASSPTLDLVAASPSLVATRGDWPRSTVVTGAWVPEPEPYTPPPALAAFLAEHPAPVVVTFGSMGGSDGRATTQLVLEALARSGRAGIVQHGYAGLLANDQAPRGVLAVGHVPHDFLFARAGCVVHHAGAGTSHAVLRAGVPSVPVPHLFDQYYWAGRLHDVGVAPKVVFRHQLSAKKLAARIEEALSRAPAARALQSRVASERGVEVAMAALDRLLADGAARA